MGPGLSHTQCPPAPAPLYLALLSLLHAHALFSPWWRGYHCMAETVQVWDEELAAFIAKGRRKFTPDELSWFGLGGKLSHDSYIQVEGKLYRPIVRNPREDGDEAVLLEHLHDSDTERSSGRQSSQLLAQHSDRTPPSPPASPPQQLTLRSPPASPSDGAAGLSSCLDSSALDDQGSALDSDHNFDALDDGSALDDPDGFDDHNDEEEELAAALFALEEIGHARRDGSSDGEVGRVHDDNDELTAALDALEAMGHARQDAHHGGLPARMSRMSAGALRASFGGHPNRQSAMRRSNAVAAAADRFSAVSEIGQSNTLVALRESRISAADFLSIVAAPRDDDSSALQALRESRISAAQFLTLVGVENDDDPEAMQALRDSRISSAQFLTLIGGPRVAQRDADAEDGVGSGRSDEESSGRSEAVPEDFLCPISHEPMLDPVVVSDGHSCETPPLHSRTNNRAALSVVCSSLSLSDMVCGSLSCVAQMIEPL